MDGLAIAASLSELRPAVEGGFIRTAYQPTRDLFLLRVSGTGAARILIGPKAATIHLTALEIPNPQKPSNFAMLLRKHLRGGRIMSVRQAGWDRIVVLEIERREGSRMEAVQLIAELVGLRGNLLLVRDGTVIGASRREPRNRPGFAYRPLTPQPKLAPGAVRAEEIAPVLRNESPGRALAREVDGVGRQTAEDILSLAEGDAESLAARVCEHLVDIVAAVGAPEPYVDPVGLRATFYPLRPPAERAASFSEALDRVMTLSEDLPESEGPDPAVVHLQRALGKRSRTIEKLRDWLDTATEAERLRHHADLLLTFQSELSSGTDRVTLTDPATEEEIEIRLDASLSPVENAQRLHGRAKRLRRGLPHVEKRLRRIQTEIDVIRRAMDAIDEGAPLPDEAIRFLPAAAPEPVRGAPLPGRRIAIGEHTVLVGRNAAENDRLLRDAAPDDVWMHARGVSGSHVIVRRSGSKEIPASVLHEAARLAARHSKAKHERRVEVTVAAVKHVRKPKGAPAGLVIVRNEDTLTVDPKLRERA